LRENRLLFAFQPVVCAVTGRVDYFECLLRMRDPDGSIVAGGEFIAIIEQLGLIGSIDGYSLEGTVRELSDHPGINLGLNISGLTTCDGCWLRTFVQLVQGRPELARRLVVEITETAVLQDIKKTARFVDILHHAGCRVALDDFGAGHTSMQQLQILALDIVKIDGSLVRDAAHSQEKRIVIHDLIERMQELGCTTVAEGIENADDATCLRVQGIGYLQGYHLGRPTTERLWLAGSAL
jgi:EAL domain-containing protein (putative c-di-GMP-specific phosphodiesterase class I)